MHACLLYDSKHTITVWLSQMTIIDDNLLLKAHLKTSRKKKHCISSFPPPSVPTPLPISHFSFSLSVIHTSSMLYSPFQFSLTRGSLSACSVTVMFFLPSNLLSLCEMLRRQQRSDWIKIVWLMCSTLKRERENVKEAEMQEGKEGRLKGKDNKTRRSG